MKRTLFVSTLALCLGILAGCGAARPIKFYQLSTPHDDVPGSQPAPYPVTLLVGPIACSHLYRDDYIVYTSEAQAMGMYQYERWAEPPSEMINDILLRELMLSGRYQHVYSLRSDVRGNYLLRGHLYDFREISGSVVTARVAFEFELRDTKAGTTVWSRYYSHDEPVNGKDVTAVVAALNRNVLNGLNEITASLEQYFAGQSAAAPEARLLPPNWTFLAGAGKAR
jgi:ABC-type uncharacterized transport system auxiliary subunit